MIYVAIVCFVAAIALASAFTFGACRISSRISLEEETHVH